MEDVLCLDWTLTSDISLVSSNSTPQSSLEAPGATFLEHLQVKDLQGHPIRVVVRHRRTIIYMIYMIIYGIWMNNDTYTYFKIKQIVRKVTTLLNTYVLLPELKTRVTISISFEGSKPMINAGTVIITL